MCAMFLYTHLSPIAFDFVSESGSVVVLPKA